MKGFSNFQSLKFDFMFLLMSNNCSRSRKFANDNFIRETFRLAAQVFDQAKKMPSQKVRKEAGKKRPTHYANRRGDFEKIEKTTMQ